MQKNSLKDILFNILKTKGFLTLENVEYICHNQKKKFSNAERRLREGMNAGWVTAKRDERGCIIFYIYIKQEPIGVPAAQHQLQEALFKARHLIK